jgi:hypothetical protein
MKIVKFLMGETSKKNMDDNQGLIDNEEDSQVEDADLAELSPIGDEETFAREIEKMVASEAPRVFALCEEIGQRVDAATVAWGLCFQDGHTELIYGPHDYRSRTTVVCGSAERARDFFATRSRKVGCTIRLVWVDHTQTRTQVT